MISVIIPTYNRAHLLPRTIDSVLVQTFYDFELIIVDDGSTDNSIQVVKSYEDPRIRLISSDHKGAAAARNVGASIANGKYLIFLDSDDEALPEWLGHFVKAFEDPKVGIVCAGVNKIIHNGKGIKKTIVLPTNSGQLYHYQTVLFLAGAFAIRSEVFEAIGGYNNNRTAGQHNELALRIIPHCLAQGWTIYSIPIPLANIYLHQGERIRRNPAAILQAAEDTLQTYESDFQGKSPAVYATYCGVAGVNAAKLGKYREAQLFFIRAIKANPWQWKQYIRLGLTYFPPLGNKVWRRNSNVYKV